MAEAYCVKCKAKRDMTGPKEVTMKGKGGKTRMAMTGTCAKCGTKMFRIMGIDKFLTKSGSSHHLQFLATLCPPETRLG